jgi:hypothetical protein
MNTKEGELEKKGWLGRTACPGCRGIFGTGHLSDHPCLYRAAVGVWETVERVADGGHL